MSRLVIILAAVVSLTSGCASKLPSPVTEIDSPLGIYQSDTEDQFWLALLANELYYICDPLQCEKGKYERVAVDYGVILLDFYGTATGQAMEHQIHGRNASPEFIAAMRDIRQAQLRPNDLVFNLSFCEDLICAVVGHSRDGVTFYRIESFDNVWNIVD